MAGAGSQLDQRLANAAVLGDVEEVQQCFGDAAQPLYASLAARVALSPAEWAGIPAPCPGLGAALPAVLARSTDEAALLVDHLPPADKAHLRTLSQCLGRIEHHLSAPLHTPVVWRLLALSLLP